MILAMREEKKVTSFTIDRRAWLRGEGSENSYLLRSGDGKMDAIGMYLAACGVSKRELENVKTPHRVGSVPEQAKWLLEMQGADPRLPSPPLSQDCYRIMLINDSDARSNQERETMIICLFAWHEINVNFID